MAVTKEELQSFHQFTGDKLDSSSAESFQELLDLWNARRLHDQSVAGIQESVSQYESGDGLPVDEALGQVRRELAGPNDLSRHRHSPSSQRILSGRPQEGRNT